MRSHFNNYYYVSGDFKNGFLFALGGAHKQNKLSEINNENMNGLLRLAQPGSRASGALELKAQAPRARGSPPQRAAHEVAGLSAAPGLPAASPRPPPSPPCPPALEARGLALGPDRREKLAQKWGPHLEAQRGAAVRP